MLCIAAAFVFAGAAFSLDVPEPQLLLRFFRERLTSTEVWLADSRCEIFVFAETLSCENSDTIIPDRFSSSTDCATSLSPFALSYADITEPLRLADMEFDSVTVNKTRTRVEDVMCWKFKLFLADEIYYVYLSGDGLFRVMRLEQKGRGKSNSDDIWEFYEVGKGRDLPVRITRTVVFGWGDSETNLISIREFTNLRRAASEGEP